MPSLRHAERITIVLSPTAEEFIRLRVDPVVGFGRPSLSVPATNTIERYAALIQIGDSIAKQLVSDAEFDFLRDILNGKILTPETITCLWMELNDAQPEFAVKRGIDQSKLVTTLKNLPTHALCAIAEDIEAYRRAEASGHRAG
jgi:hypothetical protein